MVVDGYIILAPQRLKQKGCEFKAILGLRDTYLVLKQPNNNKTFPSFLLKVGL